MRYDVLIVGAGPAGAAAALRLARAGAGVCVVERAQFPRVKACGEYLSCGTVRMLEDLGVAGALAPHAAVLHGIRLSGSGTSVELPLHEPAWSLPRATLDAALLDAAVKAGANLILGRAERFTRMPDGIRAEIRLPSGQTQYCDASVLIGADGAHSIVAREFKLSAPVRGGRRFALGGHYAGLRGLNSCLEMFVDGSSYFAINPFTGSRANVMLIVGEDALRQSRDDVDGFMRERAHALSGGRIRFDGAVLEGKRIAVGPLRSRARRFQTPGVLLTGDSAQFIDPFTGQGVSLALRGAQLAAQAVISHFAGDASESIAWREYENRLRHELRRRSRLSAIVLLLVRAPLIARRAAALFESRPRIFRPLFEAVTGTR